MQIKKVLIILFVALFSFSICYSQEQIEKDLIINTIKKQVKELEGVHKIDFQGQTLTVIFGIPGDVDEETFEVGYQPESGFFFFNRLFSQDPDYVEKSIRHELGHFYADIISRNVNGTWWPELEYGNSYAELIIRDMLGEGIAEYFGRTSDDEEIPLEDFPESVDEFTPKGYENDLIYDGGYALIKPILDKFSVKIGVEYIVSHPPICKSNDEFKESIVRYRNDLFKSLK